MPNIESARVVPVMWATPLASRSMTTPGCPGGLKVLAGDSPPRPKTFFLKKTGSEASVTVSKFGVSPSYSGTWLNELAPGGLVPASPGGSTFQAWPGAE